MCGDPRLWLRALPELPGHGSQCTGFRRKQRSGASVAQKEKLHFLCVSTVTLTTSRDHRGGGHGDRECWHDICLSYPSG